MAATATELTRNHYQRPEVRDIISKFALPGEGFWRALNGDFHRWYRYSKEGGLARLINATEDYDEITNAYRTLYQTLNVFDPGLWMIARPKKEITSDNPLGTPADTVAYTLGTDIDKGHGCDIEDPEVKKAVEAAAQFLVDYLKEHGIHESVWVLFSGGGIYVEVHHELCRPKSSAPEDRQAFFEELTDRYNTLIKHVETEFFEAHPEYIDKVKYDALNNSKRVFKCILSIHKKKPYAVTPLNRDAIKIDFERTRVPLKADMIDEAKTWYSTFDPAEREPLLKLLDEFKETEEEKKRSTHHFEEIWISSTKADQKAFPPCIRHIINIANPGEGKTRFTAVLSTFLYQMGWDEEEAWNLVKTVSDQNGLNNAGHVFDSCFGRISCPSCKTIQEDGAGYPHLGLKGLGACSPDDKCDKWPGDYGVLDFFSKMKEANAKSNDNGYKGALIELKDVADIHYDKNGKITEIRFSPTFAAQAVLDRMPLAMSKDSEDIYRFDGQIYRPDGARIIDLALCGAAGDLLTALKLREVLRRIKNILLDNPVVFDPDPYLLGVKNGVANLLTGEVREYRPEDLIQDQIPVSFDPSARCPAFLAFLESITPNVSDRITLIDWFAATAIKEPLAYVLFLLGLGRNGKGLYENLIKKFFGDTAFREMPLAEVGKNNFAASGFYRKRGWIASETGKKKAAIGTDFLKLTSGNGSIDGDRKNQSRIQFEPYFQTIVDTNNMPRIDDSSIGWRERFVKADLPYTFLMNPDKTNPLEKQADPDMEAKLSTPGELSGILNLVLFRSVAIGKSRTIHKRAGAEMFAEYAEQSSSVATFLEMFCEFVTEGVDFWTPSGPIYEQYCKWCSYKVGEVVDIRYFGKQLKNFCGGFEPKRSKDKDRKNTTEYKRLNFDSKRCTEVLKALQQSVSKDVSVMSQSVSMMSQSEKSQQITMSQLSQSNLWIEILKRFGDPSKIPNNPIENKGKNFIEMIETIETSALVEPVEDRLNRDKTETLTETKTIEADLLRVEEQREVDEAHTREQAGKYTPKRPKSYLEMAGSVPYDTSSPEAEKICRSFRWQLARGMAPRMDVLVKDTGFSQEAIESYLSGVPWVRKDDSSPAGIVVYLPVEASA